MIYNLGDPSREISLYIKTVVINEEENDVEAELLSLLELAASENRVDAEMSEELADSEGVDTIELCTEARIGTARNSLIEIIYNEDADDVHMLSECRILFNPANPGLVIMTKRGAVNSTLSFEEGKPHICTYETPYMPFRIRVNSAKVENRLLEEGRLYLDYILNVEESDPQHFMVNITVKDMPHDELAELFK